MKGSELIKFINEHQLEEAQIFSTSIVFDVAEYLSRYCKETQLNKVKCVLTVSGSGSYRYELYTEVERDIPWEDANTYLELGYPCVGSPTMSAHLLSSNIIDLKEDESDSSKEPDDSETENVGDFWDNHVRGRKRGTRLYNGAGSISKDCKRHEFKVRGKTEERYANGQPKYANLGAFKSYSEAVKCLDAYNEEHGYQR